ncbi:MAG: hypothetical protein SGILL_006143 [Bacillariaceae sp.]
MVFGWFSATENKDGEYDPSPVTLFLGTSKTSSYKKIDHEVTYTGTKPILVACTDEYRMPMENEKVFSTGNHPVEMLVPMLHFRDAGFKFDIATTSGESVKLEMWAYPTNDENVKNIHEEVKAMMEKPKKLSDIKSLDDYSAIFIPGGHGCMINLPQNAALGSLLHMAHERGLPTVTLCHGPAALLSTTRVEGKEFAYKGYKIMCFTDRTDGFTPKLGYLPGNMPWKCQEAVEKEGALVQNKTETGAVHQDRELITGDSPNAANNLGKLAAPILAKYAVDNNL